MSLPQGSLGGRPRSTEVDAAILDTALSLFVEGGLGAVTFEQISKRSGVSRAAIYRRWRSREDIVAHALGRLREQVEETLSNWTERPLPQVMDWFIENVPRQMLNPLYRSLSRNVLALDETSGLKAAYSELVLRPRREAFSAMIRRARAQGELPEGLDPDLIQDMLSGALLHKVLLEPAEQSEADFRDYVVRVLAGLGLISAGTRQ